MLQAVAAAESATKSRRVRRKLDQVAASGRPHGGSNRPFGYEADKMTVRPDEADILRNLVDRFLAGQSLRSLATWLGDNDIPTVNGNPWRTPTLRGMLASERIAGLRRHRGQVVGPAAWPAIIAPEQRDKVLARLDEAARTGRRSPRRYLLTGLLRCGRCEGKLFSSSRGDRRRYVCLSGPDQRGCGRLTVVAPPLEELIADAVWYRLDTPELADALAGRVAVDRHSAELGEQLTADRSQLDELAELYADRAITAREWKKARERIEARVRSAQRQLTRASHSDALHGLVGNGIELRQRWVSLDLTRQHAIVAAVLDYAIIGPGTHGARTLDPERVRPLWRL
jgi:hypothetical protein